MRCKMCGAKLKKEGDICKNCYQKYKEKAELQADNEQEIYRVKRKYSPKYNIMKNGELIFIEVLIALAGFAYYSNLIGILITILCIVAFGLWMFFNKRRAMGTKTIFYETKFKYKAKYLFIDREVVIPYEDIKDMSYFQTFSQKRCKVGDIRFYTKGFLSGFTVHDMPEIEETFDKIRDIINATR